jgi:hypothetical protein
MKTPRQRAYQTNERAVRATEKSEQEAKLVRLTCYTTAEKDFALRYLALKKRKSLNKLMNEQFDSLLQTSRINPATLPSQML